MNRLLCFFGIHNWAFRDPWIRRCTYCGTVHRRVPKGCVQREGWHPAQETRDRINHSKQLRQTLDDM